MTDNHPPAIPYLSSKVLQELYRLARKYHQEGVVLFIFGSFARGDQRPNSDLDLGVEWHGEPRPEVFLRLYWEVQDLPTIRPIDVVDFAQVAPSFEEATSNDRIYLLEREKDGEERIALGWRVDA
ncbi:MAG: nucleotidyltransferase domain-containing protein [Caldilineae bacterium]|nr:MAG: nucleotidyltransferase domain-containing protein [Caldilineae bacterium]